MNPKDLLWLFLSAWSTSRHDNIALRGIHLAIQSFLMGVTPGDPWILLGSCLLLLTVALLACVFPSMRAARSEPLIAMGSEETKAPGNAWGFFMGIRSQRER